MRWRPSGKEVLRDALLGAAAGAIGTAIMTPAYSRLEKLERRSAREKEKEVGPDRPTTVILAEKVGRALGLRLSDAQKQRAAQAIHWSFGAGWGALFGVLQNHLPVPRWLRGPLFGTVVAVTGQSVLLPAFGLSPPPTRYPVDTALVGLGAHWIYGTASDGALRVMHRALG